MPPRGTHGLDDLGQDRVKAVGGDQLFQCGDRRRTGDLLLAARPRGGLRRLDGVVLVRLLMEPPKKQLLVRGSGLPRGERQAVLDTEGTPRLPQGAVRYAE